MYTLQKVKNNRLYKREFEVMGEFLILLKVEAVVKNIGYNFHLFYRDGKKPPLDIAINPNNLTIEYISFFLQDEHIKIKQNSPDIKFYNDRLCLFSDDLSIDNNSLNFIKAFEISLVKNDLIAIENGYKGEIFAYQVFDSNYILMNKENNIIGFDFKNISTIEMENLKDTKVI